MDHRLTNTPVVISLDATTSPVDALSWFAELPDACLLQSAPVDHPLRRFSFLVADPVTVVVAAADQWPAVRDQVRGTYASDLEHRADLPPFQGGWVGWLGYELGVAFDTIDRHPVQPVPIPDVALGLYDWVIAWDHHRDMAWLISTGINASGRPDRQRAQSRADAVAARWFGQLPAATTDPATTTISAPESNFTRASYEAMVSRVVDYVLAGDIFQANVAQQFTAPFDGDPLVLYRALIARTSAPMAAFIRHGDTTLLSASPERFVSFDAASRLVETRPIKGTRPRSANPARDAELARELQSSGKDRAENVMIVDLLRNDLSRVCEAGTVRVTSLCALESHATVHHLVSTVAGRLAPEHDALDLLAATFPGGSVTGAPKLRAMEIITELETVARGAYSGAIGWIGLHGGMDTNIAIRTVTLSHDAASFHAGGGITARSLPAQEYDETLDKARALIDAIGDAT